MADQAKKLQVDIIARIDKLEKAMAKAAGVTDRQMTKVESRAKTMTTRLDAQFNKIGSGLKGGALAAIAGIGTGAAAALAPVALFSAALAELGRNRDLLQLSERIGLSTTQLQVLQQQAQLVGIDINTLGDGLGDFAAKVAEASANAGPLAEIFKANNVELRKSDGAVRSTRDMLAEYANLIKNASTPAEQLFLAQQAFGDEAAKMVGLFKGGARGIEEMERQAVSAGNIIDEELVKRAAEMDKRWAETWQSFSVNARSAILSAVQGMDKIRGIFAEYEQRKAAYEAGSMVGAMVPPKGSVLTTSTGDRPTGLDARMAGVLADKLTAADQKLVDALKARYGDAATKATIIPGNDGGGGGTKRNVAAEKAIRDAERVVEYITALKEERGLIGATNVEREKANALRQAGAAATAEQRREIATLVEAIYSEEEAFRASQEAADFLKGTLADAFMDMVPAIETGNRALDNLLNTLIQATTQAALLGSGPLATMFGGGGGLLSGIGKILGFDEGGYTGNGGKYQPAGVVHKGEFVFSKAATSKIGAGNLEALHASAKRGFADGGFVAPTVVSAPRMPSIQPRAQQTATNINMPITINAPGADAAALERVRAEVKLLGRNVPKMVEARLHARQVGRGRA